MTHPRNAPSPGTSAGADAEKAAFLRDLRALRDHAGLGPRDLAARAHFPEDTLTTAEAGPALPSLPVLQAYVRGCGAGEAEWEDRWRRLNQDNAAGGSDLPTRAPAAARPPARVVPFPGAEAEQEAIGFGLARVARGLASVNPDPADSAAAGATGWFDPPAKATSAPSMFAPPPVTSSTPSPPPAPPVTPEVAETEQDAPTMQYPTLSGYEAPQSYRESYTTPVYHPPTYEPPEDFRAPVPPEEFRTPVPEPPSTPPPAPPGPSATFAGLGTPAQASQAPAPPPAGPAPASVWSSSAPAGSPASSGSSAAVGSSAVPKAHAAPGSPWRRTARWVVAAVIALLIIGAVLWLLVGH